MVRSNILFTMQRDASHIDLSAFELRHLRYFVAVAEELHFGRAARRLGIAQPPLSQQIRQLEQRLGVALFIRTSRQVALTPAGEALLRGARRVLAELGLAAAAARRAGAGETDALRVAYTDSAALSVLPSAIQRFRSAMPTVHLDLVEGSTAAQIDAVGRDLVDLAVVRGPVVQPALRTEVVLREPFLLALPDPHPLTARARVELAALGGEPMVLFPRHLAPDFHDTISAMCRAAGFTPLVAYEGAEYQTILSLVAAGLGVSLVPRSVGNLQRRGVVYRELPDAPPRAEIAAVCRAENWSLPLESMLESLRAVGGPLAL
jgi:DNA-binding transcriptional LysR family regulator